MWICPKCGGPKAQHSKQCADCRAKQTAKRESTPKQTSRSRRDEEWKLDGLCNQIGGDLWFPVSDSQAARQVCGRCPVRQQCLDYALVNGEQDGIWGGTSANQRRQMPGWTPKEAYSDYRRAS